MSELSHRRFLRCWSVYLDRITDRIHGMTGAGEGEFPRHIRRILSQVGTVVRQWPMVWPSVENMFSPRKPGSEDLDYEAGQRLFMDAVEYAERMSPL